MPRLFGLGRSKSKSNVAAAAAAAAEDDVGAEQQRKVKKSKSFKRIRGLLKKTVGGGRSKKQLVSNDEQSLYGVDVDERSVMTRQTNLQGNGTGTGSAPGTPQGGPAPSQMYILKVVLLLMDPETRRFELLQLEFDSLKALVSDVLAQIPISVTEDALRLQSYTGIVGRESEEMAPPKLLATFCKGSEVLVAVPEGVPPRECVRLARPILSDVKVVTMLAASGIDASGWKDDSKKNRKKRSTLKTKTSTASGSSLPDGDKLSKKKSSGSSVTFSFLFVLMGALILQVFHTYVSAPIKPGSVTAPGTWLTKCGLLTLWPSCDNAYVHLDRSGVLTYYNTEKEIRWTVQGGSCATSADGCVPGLQVLDDGNIVIGGQPAKYVIAYGGVDPSLTPWPFVEAPKLRVWKK